MQRMKQLAKSIWTDQQGGEVIEYALIAGLIVVVCVALIGAIGNKVMARWTSVNSSI